MKSQLLGWVAAAIVLLGATSVTAQNTGNSNANNSNFGGNNDSSSNNGATSTTQFTELSNAGVGTAASDVVSLNGSGLRDSQSTTARGGGRGGIGGFGMGGFGASGLGQGLGSSTQTKPTLRTRLRSGIDVVPLPTQQIQSTAQSRFYQTPSGSGLSGVQVNMVQGTAVIQGVVRSEKDRRMSELLMRLEPGVRNVSNQVIVLP